MLSIVTTVLALASAALAAPAPPNLTYLYQVNLTMPASAVVDIGNVPFGKRAVLGITGGSFEGPRMKGKVVIGTDWGLTDLKGTFQPDAIYVLETDDKATIFVTEKGRVPNVHVLFETAAEKYSWLNNAVAYAGGGPNANGDIQLDVWQLG